MGNFVKCSNNSCTVKNVRYRNPTFYVSDPNTKIVKKDGTPCITKPISLLPSRALSQNASLKNQPSSPSVFSKNRFLPLSNRLAQQADNVRPKDYVKLVLLNSQSLKNKTDFINDFRDEHEVDLLLVTESWLKQDDIFEIGQLQVQGKWNYLHTPREGRPGGGVACISKSSLNVKKIHSKSSRTFEHLIMVLEKNGLKFTLVVVYRPEPSKANRYRMDEFFEEFTDFVSNELIHRENLVIAGDFNFHVNDPNDVRAKHFLNVLDMLQLNQHVAGSTHKSGNTLDLVISSSETTITDCHVGELISDHFSVHFGINMSKPKSLSQLIKYRKTKDIEVDKFKADVRRHVNAVACSSSLRPLDELIHVYNSTKEVLDKHAPVKEGKIIMREPTPWSSSEIKKLKLEKRKAEKRYKKSCLQKDFETYKIRRNELNNFICASKAKFLSDKIKDTKGNSKAMFKVINSSLNRKNNSPLPEHDDATELANEFIKFFDDKIRNLKSKIEKVSNSPSYIPSTANTQFSFSGTKLTSFRSLNESEVRKLIMSMPLKHCELDPLPAWLTRKCIDELLPLTTEIINMSLRIGDVPTSLKHGLIKPIIKKFGLECIKNNYRPVSNLTFLGKLIESAVIHQYTEHLVSNNLTDDKQSAYKKYHSTETLLTKLHNDIMLSLGRGEVVMLVLLDLSAAFDTIDHKILLNRLEHMYGLGGTALKWMESYITDRTQSVAIKDSSSCPVHLTCGVPQGSKLGPILFNSYIAPLSKIANKHMVEDEKYADDEQLIVAFKPTLPNQHNYVSKMENCITEIRKFLIENKLCNNSEKTELLLIGDRSKLAQLHIDSISIDNTVIKATDNVKNLGVFFDKHMSMEKQVNSMCKKAYYNIKNISKIRKSLSLDDAKTVVNALVTPHLDYGNSLLTGINKKLLNKLQVAQNSAVRLIHRVNKRDPVTQLRKQLHWLPIPARIQYKIATTVWKGLNNQAPKYIKDLITIRRPPRELRSSHRNILDYPDPTTRNKYTERSFSVMAPKIWNKLSLVSRNKPSLDCFKKSLKTELFTKFYT